MYTGSEGERVLRQQAIREHLISLACEPGEHSAIASAVALLQADGTVKISARGVDHDIALQLSNALDDLSEAVRWHAFKPRRRSRQSGIVSLSIAITMAFMAADYLNQVPWVDAGIILAAQLIAHYLATSKKYLCVSPSA